MRVWFACSGADGLKQVQEAGARHVLVSVAHYKKPHENLRCKYTIDSGAFTNFTPSKISITLAEYKERVQAFLQDSKFKKLCSTYYTFDHINSQARTLANHENLLAAGFKPCFVTHLFAKQTDQGRVEKYLESDPWVAIGGWVTSGTNPAYVKTHGKTNPVSRDEMMRHGERLFEICARTKTKIHGFGACSPRVLKAFPFAAVDTSTWANGSAWGKILVFEADGPDVRLRYLDHREPRARQAWASGGRGSLSDHKDRNKYNVRSFLKLEKYITEGHRTGKFRESFLEGHIIEALDESRTIFVMPGADAQPINEGMRQAFGSSGGKRFLAKTIVQLLPEHQRYVEPFAGGAAVFFAKAPGEDEVLADRHPDIANAYKVIQGLTATQVQKLQQRRTTFSRDHFFAEYERQPSDALDRFYRFSYLHAFSHGGDRHSTAGAHNFQGVDIAQRFQRYLDQTKARLEGVKIHRADFLDMISKYDGPSTFFYLDPPYPDQESAFGNDRSGSKNTLSNQDILDGVQKIKRGKFLLSMADTPEVRKLFSRFTVKPVQVRRTKNASTAGMDTELLIANYPLRSSDRYLAEGLLGLDDELREAHEGDPMLVIQEPGKVYAASFQEHSRGVWPDAQRRGILDGVEESAGLDGPKRAAFLEKLWKDEGLTYLRVTREALRQAVAEAQSRGRSVDGVMTSRTSADFPGVSTMLRLLAEDRIFNRGNMHLDIRTTAPGGQHLLGWTLLTPGVAGHFLRSGELVAFGANRLTEGDGQVRATPKGPHSPKWLRVVTPESPVFEILPGGVGATSETAGRFSFVAGGGETFNPKAGRGPGMAVVYGVRRTDFLEQFHLFEDPDLMRTLGGRWVFRLLPLAASESRRPTLDAAREFDDDLERALAWAESQVVERGRDAAQFPALVRDACEGDEVPVHRLREQGEPVAQLWLARRVDDVRPFIFEHDFQSESERAAKDDQDLIWNHPAVDVLDSLGYFKAHGLEDELARWRNSDRGNAPPDNGIFRYSRAKESRLSESVRSGTQGRLFS